MDQIVHFINSAAHKGQSDRTQEVFNPTTCEAEKAVVLAVVDDVDAAMAAAKAAWPKRSKTPALRRARILARFKNIFGSRLDFRWFYGQSASIGGEP